MALTLSSRRRSDSATPLQMMDLPDGFLTVMLQQILKTNLSHRDRAALQRVNRRLRHICSSISGSFWLLPAYGGDMFLRLRLHASKHIDGLKIQGDSTDTQGLGPKDAVDDEQLLCLALGGVAMSPAAPAMRCLHIDTGTGRLSGAALCCLHAFSSLEALKIHSLYPPTCLPAALQRLTALTFLDLKVQEPCVPEWCRASANTHPSEADGLCYTFPDVLAACTRLRHLSLKFDAPGLMFFDELPDDFGNLCNLESLSLIARVTTLPPSFTRLTALTSLTIANSYWDDDHVQLRVPEGFCGAMCNLSDVHISWRRSS